MHLVSTDTPEAVRVRNFREILHDANAFFRVIEDIRLKKRCGTLTINFSNGSPSGALKWTEPAKGE